MIACPVFYIYSENDKIVLNYHTKKLYEKTNYPKRIMGVKGYVLCYNDRDHNGIRDADIKGKVVDFLLELVLEGGKQQRKMKVDV